MNIYKYIQKCKEKRQKENKDRLRKKKRHE